MSVEEIAKAVSLALMENGIGPLAPDGMHGWRCEWPNVYGPCECFAETVTDVVDAVMRIANPPREELDMQASHTNDETEAVA